ncbi:MAG: hypothetical protein ACRDF5_10685 [bacterium]
MRRALPLAVAALLVLAAFAAGYVYRSSGVFPAGQSDGKALAQSPSPPPPSPPSSPSTARGGQRDRGDRGIVTGTIERVQGRVLVVKVTSARGVKTDRGGTLSAEVGPDVSVLREIALSELKKGNSVTLRGGMEGDIFIVRQVIVELR